ncbi:hypothetical protein ACFORO_12305 [Amycolatopsis halotolerans]|uniref:Regulatory protein RecX n=1 Tax=Amycolatopsis halotolerans TaxID=330083 RepID=A0ABV7QFC9_9PSEU
MNPHSKYAPPTEQGRTVVGRTHPRDDTARQREQKRAAAFVRSRGFSAEDTAELLDMLGLGEVA